MPYPQTKGHADKTENLGKIIYAGDGTNFYPIKGNRISGSSIILEVDTLNTETIQTEMLASTLIAASTIALSSTISLIGVKRATYFIDHGR